MVARGDVVWLEVEDAGRRPVLVLTRDEALQRLRNVVVALITRTVRGIDTEVELGPDDGMPVACAISLDNLRTVPQALLTERITRIDAAKLDSICRALARSARLLSGPVSDLATQSSRVVRPCWSGIQPQPKIGTGCRGDAPSPKNSRGSIFSSNTRQWWRQSSPRSKT